MTQWGSSDYAAAGMATLSRQVSFTVADYAFGAPTAGRVKKLLLAASHKAEMSTKIIEMIVGYSSVLVEQSAYPLLLQISEELDKLMEAQIPIEENQLRLFTAVHPFLLVANPLAWISMGNYIDSFQAQIDCHQKVLEHYQSLWEYKTTTVNYVIDGDTVFVDAYEESVRIEGIDCPELGTDEGEAARVYAEERLLNQEVELRTRHKLDYYGRRVARVYLEGKNFANELVLNGHAKFIFWQF